MLQPFQARTLALAGAALPTFGIDGQSVFVPVSLTGTETLGELFRYTLTCRTADELAFSPGITANIDLNRLVGSEVTVSIQIEGKGHFIAGMPGNSGMGNIGAGTREISGLVDSANLLREEARGFVYELVLRPWAHKATKNANRRIFQNRDVVEITREVLSAYPFPVDFRLVAPRRGVWPKRDMQTQYDESDWTFLHRLWEEWGIFCFFEHSDGAHRLVLVDSVGALQPHGEAYGEIRYQSPSAKRIDEEHFSALSVHSSLTAGRVTHTDYDYTRPRASLTGWDEDPRGTAHANQEIYTWGDHSQPLAGPMGLSGEAGDTQAEADYLARVRMQALRCVGLRATGEGNVRGLVTGQTFTLTHYPQQAANGEYLVVSASLDIHEVAQASGSGQQYQCRTRFEIQPAFGEQFRMPQLTPRPLISGVQSAIVTGPADQVLWTDAMGRIKVQLAWDRYSQRDENSSIWVRVSSSWQGSQMGATFVPRIGHEVLVTFINGDPDLPVVTGCVVNAMNMPVHEQPGNQAVSVIGSQEHHGTRTSSLSFDDTSGRIQTQLASDHGASQLSLGFITRIFGNRGRQDTRGEGFDLRTDLWGVLRAARGMLITTEGRPDAQAHAKDMGETVARLTQARDLQESLASLAQQAGTQQQNAGQSEVAKAIKAQNDALRGRAAAGSDSFPEMTEPMLAISSPAGVQVTTAGSTHLASDEHLALTTGGNVGIAVGRSFFASIANAFSLFVHRLGIALVAASGKVRIEAQNDGIGLTAKKEVEIVSTTGWINVTASQGIRLNGGGTEVEISAAGYIVRTRGQHLVHAASHATEGAQSVPAIFPSFGSISDTRTLSRLYHDDDPVTGAKFTIDYDNGQHFGGALDGAGHADLGSAPDGAGRIRFGADAREWQSRTQDLNPAHKASWKDGDFAASASKNSNGAS